MTFFVLVFKYNFLLDPLFYSKIVELEEELRVVGNNLKSLEVSEEKVRNYNFYYLLHTKYFRWIGKMFFIKNNFSDQFLAFIFIFVFEK